MTNSWSKVRCSSDRSKNWTPTPGGERRPAVSEAPTRQVTRQGTSMSPWPGNSNLSSRRLPTSGGLSVSMNAPTELFDIIVFQGNRIAVHVCPLIENVDEVG